MMMFLIMVMMTMLFSFDLWHQFLISRLTLRDICGDNPSESRRWDFVQISCLFSNMHLLFCEFPEISLLQKSSHTTTTTTTITTNTTTITTNTTTITTNTTTHRNLQWRPSLYSQKGLNCMTRRQMAWTSGIKASLLLPTNHWLLASYFLHLTSYILHLTS